MTPPAALPGVQAGLVDAVWGSTLPATAPQEGAATERIADGVNNLASRVRRGHRNLDLVVPLPYGFDSHLRLIEPHSKPTCATVAWHGHGFDTPGIVDLAHALANAGCAVVLGWMPMFGPNPKPTVDTALGRLQITRHDQLTLVEDRTSTLALFLEPVAAAVNLLSERWPDLPVSMVGISGGGWTTTVYAALDERVRLSIPIAGTLPNFLRAWDAEGEDRGDYEQQHPAVPEYLDLYVLATTGGRSQVQVLIEGDPCCFDARGDRHSVYEDAVAEAAAAVGGTFDVRVFAQDEHAVGPDMRCWIVERMSAQACDAS